MFSKDDQEKISRMAQTIGIEPAALLVVAEVESGGVPYAFVDGRQEPLIRFEGHYFDRRLSGESQALARAAGLADPNAGAVANPASQAARWQLLTRAAAIDRKAAYESTSWGIGQVMGAHWAWLGYDNVNGLVAEARSGLEGQARLMCRYIDKAGLAGALRARDWATFARGYNGPAFARNGYDRRLKAAYQAYAKQGYARSSPTLRRGMRGESVRELQTELDRLGYATEIDGIFGPRTADSVIAFQHDHGLASDGVVGSLTAEALRQTGAPAALDGIWMWIGKAARALFALILR